MGDYWIKVDGKARGPYTIDAMKKMVQEGRLSDHDEVWLRDEETWASVEDLKRNPLFVSHAGHELNIKEVEGSSRGLHISESVQAKPWRRFFARVFDMWLLVSLVVTPVAMGLAYYFPRTYLSVMPDNEAAASAIFIAAAVLVEMIVYGVFGNTAGKALLGIKVVDMRGDPVSPMDYASRNIRLWFSGLAMGIPFLNFVTMLIQHRKLTMHGFTSYDSVEKTRVLSRSKSKTKTFLFVAGFAILIAVNAVISGM